MKLSWLTKSIICFTIGFIAGLCVTLIIGVMK